MSSASADNGSTTGTSNNNSSGYSNSRFHHHQPELLAHAIHFFYRHIRNDSEVERRMEGNKCFEVFFEPQYHVKQNLNRIFADSVHDSSPVHVSSFILSILHQGIFSVAAFIISVIYLSRFKEASQITLHSCTWRPLFLTTLLVADKVWEDKPVRNSSLAKLFPVLSNGELNEMEKLILLTMEFNVNVKPDLFGNFCEKLLTEQVHPEINRSCATNEYSKIVSKETSNVCSSTPDSTTLQNLAAYNGNPQAAELTPLQNLQVMGHNRSKHVPRHVNLNVDGIMQAVQNSYQKMTPEQTSNKDRPRSTGPVGDRQYTDNDPNRPRSMGPITTNDRRQQNGMITRTQQQQITSYPPLQKGQSLPQHKTIKNIDQSQSTVKSGSPNTKYTPNVIQGQKSILGIPLRRSLPAKTTHQPLSFNIQKVSSTNHIKNTGQSSNNIIQTSTSKNNRDKADTPPQDNIQGSNTRAQSAGPIGITGTSNIPTTSTTIQSNGNNVQRVLQQSVIFQPQNRASSLPRGVPQQNITYVPNKTTTTSNNNLYQNISSSSSTSHVTQLIGQRLNNGTIIQQTQNLNGTNRNPTILSQPTQNITTTNRNPTILSQPTQNITTTNRNPTVLSQQPTQNITQVQRTNGSVTPRGITPNPNRGNSAPRVVVRQPAPTMMAPNPGNSIAARSTSTNRITSPVVFTSPVTRGFNPTQGTSTVVGQRNNSPSIQTKPQQQHNITKPVPVTGGTRQNIGLNPRGWSPNPNPQGINCGQGVPRLSAPNITMNVGLHTGQNRSQSLGFRNS